ncbi:MAG: putative oxidoreductase YteT precursor [candidate division TA06 bacterium ADurb.Bin131]|uniref:Oxidoreductase YteT n=1 Tax=candidate division TA06 bacterium ADurb.Bin131 TaxID=1852827 RepID=A0A1V6C9P5_UNCT6|nr:MAG: putative oxidoreductase YteT precursor [candidate division TA06 bacterium ADurb.Bin131]HQL65247.1 Gfo/Idh/MocA family oxidoreductase [bacterium]
MNKKLKIGVIGAGGRGRLAHLAHKPEEGVELIAGVDMNKKVLEEFKEKFPDSFVSTDYRELLKIKDIDAVFVTTPDFLHEEHALAAIEAGKAVYLEKPMTITIDGCDKILKRAKEKNVKIYVGHNMRHFSTITMMRNLINSGVIGDVKAGWCRHFVAYGGDAYFKDWHAERAKSTGLLLQKGAHDIDVLHWLCGGYTKRVVAFGGLTLYDKIKDRHSPEERGDASFRIENWPPLTQKQLNPIIDVEDISMMLMELDNGVFCSYQQCHYTPDGWRNYTIIGTHGRIENFGDGPGDSVIKVWHQRSGYNPYGDIQYFVPPASGSHGGSDPSIVDEFIRFVRDDTQIRISPVEARNSVAAGYMATMSLRDRGTPMDIPPVPQEIIDYYNRFVIKKQSN